MAQKVLVNGTSYNVVSGKSLVSGTSYSIINGKTAVNGTSYTISFAKPKLYAMYYSDQNIVFQYGNAITAGKTLTNEYVGFDNQFYSSYYAVPWKSYARNIKYASFAKNTSTQSMTYWFYNHRNLVSINLTNLNIDSIINMANAYRNCINLTGSPVCGNNVTNMAYAYNNCRKLTGSPVCGNNVTNMANAYYGCKNLTGSPVCGNNVTNISYTYENCYNLTGSPVCGNNVINMIGAYRNCYNLTGSPVCGNNVTLMTNAYYGCKNLTGSPVCGNNVTAMANAYRNCKNLHGTMYIYSKRVVGMQACFAQRNTSNMLNIYIYENSSTHNCCKITNSYSIVGSNITWTNTDTGFYNTKYNIYVYYL